MRRPVFLLLLLLMAGVSYAHAESDADEMDMDMDMDMDTGVDVDVDMEQAMTVEEPPDLAEDSVLEQQALESLQVRNLSLDTIETGSLHEGDYHHYFFSLAEATTKLEVHLHPCSGNPDVFVSFVDQSVFGAAHKADETPHFIKQMLHEALQNFHWKSDAETGVDRVVVSPATAGLYYVSVHGTTNCTYEMWAQTSEHLEARVLRNADPQVRLLDVNDNSFKVGWSQVHVDERVRQRALLELQEKRSHDLRDAMQHLIQPETVLRKRGGAENAIRMPSRWSTMFADVQYSVYVRELSEEDKEAQVGLDTLCAMKSHGMRVTSEPKALKQQFTLVLDENDDGEWNDSDDNDRIFTWRINNLKPRSEYVVNVVAHDRLSGMHLLFTSAHFRTEHFRTLTLGGWDRTIVLGSQQYVFFKVAPRSGVDTVIEVEPVASARLKGAINDPDLYASHYLLAPATWHTYNSMYASNNVGMDTERVQVPATYQDMTDGHVFVSVYAEQQAHFRIRAYATGSTKSERVAALLAENAASAGKGKRTGEHGGDQDGWKTFKKVVGLIFEILVEALTN